MAALAQGTQAPAFTLKSLSGTTHSLVDILKQNAAVVVAFLKVSCPVCHLAFPYLERLHRSYPDIPIWGISQDDADSSQSFAKMFGCTFPILIDDALEITTAYNLTHVPSIFLVEGNLTINESVVGFVKSDLERINHKLAGFAGVQSIPLFTSADEVPAFKPGCVSKQPV